LQPDRPKLKFPGPGTAFRLALTPTRDAVQQQWMIDHLQLCEFLEPRMLQR